MSTVIKLKRSETLNTIPTTSDIEVGEVAVNTADKKIYIRDSSNNIVAVADKNITYTKYNSNTSISSNTGVIADTSAGSFTVTLPASPVTGDKIEIVDGSGTFGTYPLTVARNGNKIADISDDLSLNISGAAANFIYNTDTWEVYVQIGSNSGGSVTLSGSQTFTNKTISGSSNTLSNIGNSSLTNSSVTINGTSVSLGGSATVTAAAGTLTGNTLSSGVTSSSLTSVGTLTQASVTYEPGSATGAALQVSAKGTQGGTNYADFLKVTNTKSGATNPNKWFRVDNVGSLEIINSGYTSSLLSITESGDFNVKNSISINGKVAVNGPAFRAYHTADQTITSGSQQKVTFGTETFDTNGCFASDRFTPTVEGYYQLNSTIRISGGSSTGEIILVLYKNGSEYSRGNNESGTEQGSSFYSQQVSDIAYANGTTDYFEVYIQQTSGSSKNITSGSQISYFSGVMVRGG